MALLKSKQADPISDRARTLSAQIAALEAEIQELDTQILRRKELRESQPAGAPDRMTPEEPVFEPVNHRRVTTAAEPESTTGHYNDQGVRKYDLAAAWRRFQSRLQGPKASNPKLINYLAAGSIKGLRPLRYEKRVARNRVLAMTVIFVVVLLGILSAFLRH